jgi:hypothetical protein
VVTLSGRLAQLAANDKPETADKLKARVCFVDATLSERATADAIGSPADVLRWTGAQTS